MLRTAVVALAMFTAFEAQAQTEVKGRLVDADSGEPLVGAQVRIMGEQTGVVTNAEGEFTLKNPRQRRQIAAAYLGFKPQNFAVPKSGDMGTLELEPEDVMLEGVTVQGTMAFDRQTPVALSNITIDEIEEKLGGQEFPEIMKTTPGVHANKQGGGWGDSEIFMRGFDNTNVATMVNGVPMNDMENGTVYWSNWAGISDVAKIVQTQRGLGASKVSAPSVGGTINIITKTLEQKRGGTLSYQMGNDGANKITFNVSTGMSKKGWGMTLLGTRQWGDGYVQGTDYLGYTWFASIAKKFNDKHTLSFTGFGTIQDHGQRTQSQNYGPLTIAEWARVRQSYGYKHYEYNPTFGYLHGEEFNMAQNHYHKPQLSLNHDWTIDKRSSLSTVLYMSIGRGNGSTAEGHGAGSYSDFNGVQNGVVKNDFRTADGLFDYDALYDRNAQSTEGSLMALCKSVNNHLWTGILSTYKNKINDNWNVYGGLDFRWYRGDHSTVISNLLGGQYFIDDQDRSTVNPTLNPKAADPTWVYQKLYVGDKVYRDYSGYNIQEGVFGQAEFNRNGWSAYMNGAINNTTMWRYDRFYYKSSQAKSDIANFLGGNIKGGANWNIDDHHNVFANVGYISRAPKFTAAFMNATKSNYLNSEAKNEKILSFEVGYGYKCRWANVKVNGYFTRWMDKSMTKYLTLDNQETGYMNMTGVDARHMGVELEARFYPAKWVELKGMFSLGDWKWDGIGEGYVYDERSNPVDAEGNIVQAFSNDHAQARVDLKGIRVGGSAQTTSSLSVDFKLAEVLGLKEGQQLKVGADWVYYGRNYSYYSLSGSNITVKGKDVKDNLGNVIGKEWATTTPQAPWKVPAASQVDLHASYKFHIAKSVDATLSGVINNLLDYQYIGKAYNSGTNGGKADASNVYVFYNFGRTYTIRLKLTF